MSNEELTQRGYLATGKLKGSKFGDFEELNIGATSVQELRAAGVDVTVPAKVGFPFTLYKPPKKPGSAKPDRVFLRRQEGKLNPVATAEHKAPTKLRSNTELLKAAEQGLFSATALGAGIAVTSNGKDWLYVDVNKSLNQKKVVYISDKRDFGPGVLSNLLAGDAGISKDPAPLAEKVWQTIWHATKEDVTRFWTEEELVALGHKESAVMRVDFIDETRAELDEINSELEVAKKELQALTSGETKVVSLNNESYFEVRSGTRVTGKEIREHPGKLPIYSCFKTDREVKGLVDEKFFEKTKKGEVEKKAIVTVNANGASVGKVYVRRDRCGITDDVIIVDVKDIKIDHDYLAVALRAAVYKGGFLYEAKLFATRVRELEVDIPVSKNGQFNLKQQFAIANAVKRFDALRTRLHDLGIRSSGVRTV